MSKTKMFLGAAVFLVGVSASTLASAAWQAFVIEGYNGNLASSNAWLGAGAQSAATYIGDVPDVYFNSNGGADYTIGSWLGTGGYNYTGSIAGDTLDDTLWLFYTDKYFHAAPTLTVTHDDGIEADFGTYNQQYTGFTAGPTSAIMETGYYTGSFTDGQIGIIYNETAGPPGVRSERCPRSYRHGR